MHFTSSPLLAFRHTLSKKLKLTLGPLSLYFISCSENFKLAGRRNLLKLCSLLLGSCFWLEMTADLLTAFDSLYSKHFTQLFWCLKPSLNIVLHERLFFYAYIAFQLQIQI